MTTTNETMTPAQRAARTRSENLKKRAIREQQEREARKAQLVALERVRDDKNSTPTEVLEAVKLLEQIKEENYGWYRF